MAYGLVSSISFLRGKTRLGTCHSTLSLSLTLTRIVINFFMSSTLGTFSNFPITTTSQLPSTCFRVEKISTSTLPSLQPSAFHKVPVPRTSFQTKCALAVTNFNGLSLTKKIQLSLSYIQGPASCIPTPMVYFHLSFFLWLFWPATYYSIYLLYVYCLLTLLTLPQM